MHLVGFIIRIYHDAPSSKRQIHSVICFAFFFLSPNVFYPKYQSTCPQNITVQHPRRKSVRKYLLCLLYAEGTILLKINTGDLVGSEYYVDRSAFHGYDIVVLLKM